MAKSRITKRSVDALKAGEVLFDTDLSGFMVRNQGGRTVYAVKYVSQGRQRIITLGQHGPLTPEQARSKAMDVKGRIARGEDPQAEKDAARAKREALGGDGTFKGLAELYMSRYAAKAKKASSIHEDWRILKLHLLPRFGNRPLQDVRKADVLAMQDAMQDRPGAFNRTRSLLGHMYGMAEKWDLFEGRNPAYAVDKLPEKGRAPRFLKPAEYAALFDALKAAEGKEHPSVITCIRLLALTGCRLSEIRDLRWDWVDLEARTLNLPDTKTGARVIPLSAPALELLAGLQRASPFVCFGATLNAPIVGVQRPWRRIRNAAGLEGVVIHTLRHSLASLAAARGESVALIQAALGHRSIKTTEGYMHLSHDPVRAVLDRVAGIIAAAAEGKPGEVIPLCKTN